MSIPYGERIEILSGPVKEGSFVYRGHSCFCDQELIQRNVGRVAEWKKAGGQSWFNCPPIFPLSLTLTPTSHCLNLFKYDAEHLEGLRAVQQIKVSVNVDRGFHLWGIFEQIEKHQSIMQLPRITEGRMFILVANRIGNSHSTLVWLSIRRSISHDS